MLGALIYKCLSNLKANFKAAQLLLGITSIASLCFWTPALCKDERLTFWCFCLFEVCCGMYFPLMALQRGQIIEDSVRARLYGWMRIPLNVFVVICLATTKEGMYIPEVETPTSLTATIGFEHRDFVFTICAGLLMTGITSLVLQ